MDHKIIVHNVEVRNERTETGVPVTARSKGKETHVVSATMRTNVENQRAFSLSLQNRRRKAMGTNKFEKSVSEVEVRLGRDLEDRAKTTLVVYTRSIRVILGIVPSVKITKQIRDGNQVKSTLFTHREVDSQPKKRPTNGGEGSVAKMKKPQATRLRIPRP